MQLWCAEGLVGPLVGCGCSGLNSEGSVQLTASPWHSWTCDLWCAEGFVGQFVKCGRCGPNSEGKVRLRGMIVGSLLVC
jgi:hypothetical protein